MRRGFAICDRLSLLKTRKAWKSLAIYLVGHTVTGMLPFSSELLSWLADRFRSRAELELEVIALGTNWQSCIASVLAAPNSLRLIAYSGSGFTGSGRGA
jgi:hypothetical protein